MKKILSIMLTLIMLLSYMNFSYATQNYEVLQTTKVYSQRGIGGFSILADFDTSPGEIYFSRNTVKPTTTYESVNSMPFVTSSVAMVIDPSGKLAAICDFSDDPTGTTERRVTIDYYMEGIWQIKFTSGRSNDLLTIGLNNAKNWGVRGEVILGVTATTPKTSYVYVPEKINKLYVGSTNTSYPVKVYDSSNALKLTTSAKSEEFAKTSGTLFGITDAGVYKVELNSNATDYGMLVDIAPSLMCPTKEMAEALKGGWLTTDDGLLVQGSIQKAAREKIIDIIEQNETDPSVLGFAGYYTKPSYRHPQDYNTLINPYAEQYLLSGGTSPISNLNNKVNQQNLNVSSAYCGSFVADTTASWEDGEHFTNMTGSSNSFGALISVEDSQLSVFHNHKGLKNRSILALLAPIASFSEDIMFKENTTSGADPSTHGQFYFSWLSNAYLDLKPHLEGDIKALIDHAMLAVSFKAGNIRGYMPTNQWILDTEGVLSSYLATKNEQTDDMIKTGNTVLKGMLDKHINGFITGPHHGKGLSEAGYFIEDGGADGQYNNMNREIFYSMYEKLLHNEPDYKYLPQMKNIVNKSLLFDSLFYMKEKTLIGKNQYGGSVYVDMPGTNAGTSRKEAEYGPDGSSNETYRLILDEFPLAKRKWELTYGDNPMTSLYKYYGNYAAASTYGYSFNLNVYNAMKNAEEASSTIMPVEYETGLWANPGIIALKHKGLYMNIFYTNPERTSVHNNSFMGGGISLLWADGLEGIVASRKHKNWSSLMSNGNINTSNVTNLQYLKDRVMATSLFGKKQDGSLFLSGKELTELNWLEYGKRFEIAERASTNADTVDVTWTYELTNSGITMTAKALSKTSSPITEQYINIPLSAARDEDTMISKVGESYLPLPVHIESGAGYIRYKVNDEYVSFTWDGQEAPEIVRITDDYNAVMNCARIKLTGDSITIKIASKTAGTYIGDVYNEVSEDNKLTARILVENNTDTPKYGISVIHAVYDADNNYLGGVFAENIRLDGNDEKTIEGTDIQLPKNVLGIYSKTMLWDGMKNMKPYHGAVLSQIR